MIGKGAEADRPAFEDDHADFRLGGTVNRFPLGGGYAIAAATEGGLVELRDFGGLAVFDGREEGGG